MPPILTALFLGLELSSRLVCIILALFALLSFVCTGTVPIFIVLILVFLTSLSTLVESAYFVGLQLGPYSTIQATRSHFPDVFKTCVPCNVEASTSDL